MPDNEIAKATEIREFYNDYVPPRYVRKLVAALLSSVPPKYLQCLDCIVLTNQSGMPRRDRLGKVTSRRRRVPQSQVLGRYHHARPGKFPWIELYVDKLVSEVAIYPIVPFGKAACFGFVLFHEIGHHIDKTMRSEFREKEDVADEWGKKLLRNYMVSRYRFPKPVWRIIGWMLKVLRQEIKSATPRSSGGRFRLRVHLINLLAVALLDHAAAELQRRRHDAAVRREFVGNQEHAF
jgi:hypothetical protein